MEASELQEFSRKKLGLLHSMFFNVCYQKAEMLRWGLPYSLLDLNRAYV